MVEGSNGVAMNGMNDDFEKVVCLPQEGVQTVDLLLRSIPMKIDSPVEKADMRLQ